MTVLQPLDRRSLVEEIRGGNVNTLFSNSESIVSLSQDLEPNSWIGIKNIILGRSALPTVLAESLKNDGVFIGESMGLDSVGAIIAINTPDHEVVGIGGGKPMLQIGSKKGSYGRPLPGVAIKIVSDTDSNVLVEEKEVGHILVKGAIINQLENSTELEDGWLPTNERGYLDEDGFLFIES